MIERELIPDYKQTKRIFPRIFVNKPWKFQCDCKFFFKRLKIIFDILIFLVHEFHTVRMTMVKKIFFFYKINCWSVNPSRPTICVWNIFNYDYGKNVIGATLFIIPLRKITITSTQFLERFHRKFVLLKAIVSISSVWALVNSLFTLRALTLMTLFKPKKRQQSKFKKNNFKRSNRKVSIKSTGFKIINTCPLFQNYFSKPISSRGIVLKSRSCQDFQNARN